MGRAWLSLPIVISAAVVAAVVIAPISDVVAGLLLIAGAAVAIGVLDLLSRRGTRRRR